MAAIHQGVWLRGCQCACTWSARCVQSQWQLMAVVRTGGPCWWRSNRAFHTIHCSQSRAPRPAVNQSIMPYTILSTTCIHPPVPAHLEPSACDGGDDVADLDHVLVAQVAQQLDLTQRALGINLSRDCDVSVCTHALQAQAAVFTETFEEHGTPHTLGTLAMQLLVHQRQTRAWYRLAVRSLCLTA